VRQWSLRWSNDVLTFAIQLFSAAIDVLAWSMSEIAIYRQLPSLNAVTAADSSIR
jgi:hypothetical protein